MLFSDASKYFAVLTPISAQNRSFLTIPENFWAKSFYPVFRCRIINRCRFDEWLARFSLTSHPLPLTPESQSDSKSVAKHKNCMDFSIIILLA